MKYDVLCLPGVTPPGCGRVYVEDRIGDDHKRGDRIEIACKKCGRVRTIEVRARLTGLNRMNRAAST